jgi:Tfp pilus assembly protein PilV
VDRFRSRLGARRPAGDDGGFSLVEVTISLLLLTITMTAALSLFVRALGNTDVQAQRQQAITIANDRLEDTRTVEWSQLLNGRGSTAVANIWAWDPSVTTGSIQQFDSTAAAASKGTIKTIDSVPVDGLYYQVRTYIDLCYLPATSTVCGTNPVNARAMYRVTVSVTWSPKKTRTCDGTGTDTTKVLPADPNNRCQEYVVTTLRDKSSDATFNTN